MTRLEADSYSAHLRRESTRFRDVLALTPSQARVPTCPDWDADDLLWHLAEVQWFWGEVVAARPAGPPEQHPQRPASRAALLAFFDEVSARLCDLLGTAAPDEPAWSWAEEQTVGFTQRRQAHEAMIHRVDAELCAGAATPLPVDLAADGVAELLEVMYGGEPPAWGDFTPDGHLTAVELTDTGHRLVVRTGRFVGTDPASGAALDVAHLVRVADDAPAAATVAGTAADVDAWLWHRRDDAPLSVTGSPDAYAAFRAAVSEPLT
ncbi:MAG: hypothetical protein CMH82_04155 [Nocardioides sp.]|nr:hypothetical protein [Nocardioides sp.]